MKRLIALTLLLLMAAALPACGKAEEAKVVDLNAVYDSFSQVLPEMMVLDEDTMLNFLGIEGEDCLQVIAAVSTTGLEADEIWLIQAKDDAALTELQELAQIRLQAKQDELEFYLPEEYLVAKEGKVLTHGNYLALLVSPDVEALQTVFEDAVA